MDSSEKYFYIEQINSDNHKFQDLYKNKREIKEYRIKSLMASIRKLKNNMDLLNDDELLKLHKYLDELLNFYNSAQKDKKIKKTLNFVLASALGFAISFICFNLNIISALIGCLIGSGLINIPLFFYPNFKFLKYLKKNINEITELKSDIKKKIFFHPGAIYIKNEEKESNNKSNNKSKDSDKKENTLSEFISNTERVIMLLPNNEEETFNNRLKEAVEKYNNSMNISEKATTFDTSFVNNFKNDLINSTIRELKKDLANIEKDALERYKEIQNQEKSKIIDKIITTYYDRINFWNNTIIEDKFLELMKTLDKFLENANLEFELIIKDRFAECFYYTLNKLPKDNQLISKIDEKYLDRIIIYGEKILNKQVDSYVSIYQEKLYNLKSNLSKNDYLNYLIQIMYNTDTLKNEFKDQENLGKVLYYL